MAIDIYHSRRRNFRECRYITHDGKTGEFYASEITPYNNGQNQIVNAYMFDKTTVTLMTSDNVSELTQGDKVFYLNNEWFVENIQRQTHIQETEFSNEEDGTFYIALRR